MAFALPPDFYFIPILWIQNTDTFGQFLTNFDNFVVSVFLNSSCSLTLSLQGVLNYCVSFTLIVLYNSRTELIYLRRMSSLNFHVRWRLFFILYYTWNPTFTKASRRQDLRVSCCAIITVVLQCYRLQAIPMEQAKIRPSVTLYSLYWSLSNLVWLITSATPTETRILVTFGWVGNSSKINEINPSVTFCSVPFFLGSPGGKPVNGIARIRAQNAWNQPRICLLGVSSKVITPPPLTPKFRKFCIRKAVFIQNTHKPTSIWGWAQYNIIITIMFV